MLEKYVSKGSKKLRCGFTTGTCAAAASAGAARMLLSGKVIENITVMTPSGNSVTVGLTDIKKENAIKGLREFLRPEFIGRVDEIVVFNELTEDNYKDIAKLMLSELSDSLKEKSISFGYSDDVPALLVSKMDGTVRGARDLRNVIRRNVEDKISNYLVDNYDKPLKAINLSADGDEVILETK